MGTQILLAWLPTKKKTSGRWRHDGGVPPKLPQPDKNWHISTTKSTPKWHVQTSPNTNDEPSAAPAISEVPVLPVVRAASTFRRPSRNARRALHHGQSEIGNLQRVNRPAHPIQTKRWKMPKSQTRSMRLKIKMISSCGWFRGRHERSRNLNERPSTLKTTAG